MPDKPFIEHVYELRSRLFKIALATIIGVGIGYVFRDSLTNFIVSPLHQTLYYTTPGGGLTFVLKVCFLFGVLTAVPVLLYQTFMFLTPLLPRHTWRFVAGLTAASFVLLGLGVAFGYFISLSAALHFLLGFTTDQVQALITVDAYMSFVLLYLAGFGLLFQLPLIFLFINRIKPLKPGRLFVKQEWVVLASFVLAALLTPTVDPLNQVLVAGPIIVLYNISLALIWFVNRRSKRGPIDVPQGARTAFVPVASAMLAAVPAQPTLSTPSRRRSPKSIDGFTPLKKQGKGIGNVARPNASLSRPTPYLAPGRNLIQL